ncbi:MAG: hypothetical protein ACRD30_04580 [Bryobacteraceae bacterium]
MFSTASGATIAAGKPQTPQIQPVFDAQGLATGQTLRLGVSSIPGQAPCSGTLSFTDAANNPVGTSSTFSLQDGQSAYLSLPSTAIPSLSGWTGKRGEFRPVVTLPSGGAAVCLATVQTFATTSGLTQMFSEPVGLP